MLITWQNTMQRIGLLGFFSTLLIAGGLGATLAEFVLPKLFPSNLPPMATINPSTTSPISNEEVSYDAFRSNDPEGRELYYSWKVDGPHDITIPSPSAGNIRFLFPREGVYTIILTVTDSEGLQRTDSLKVHVSKSFTSVAEPQPPAAVERSQVFQFCMGERASVCASAHLIGNCDDHANRRENGMILSFCQDRLGDKATVKSASRSTQAGGKCGYVFRNFWCESVN